MMTLWSMVELSLYFASGRCSPRLIQELTGIKFVVCLEAKQGLLRGARIWIQVRIVCEATVNFAKKCCQARVAGEG